jgi:hypothetical protein
MVFREMDESICQLSILKSSKLNGLVIALQRASHIDLIGSQIIEGGTIKPMSESKRTFLRQIAHGNRSSGA